MSTNQIRKYEQVPFFLQHECRKLILKVHICAAYFSKENNIFGEKKI